MSLARRVEIDGEPCLAFKVEDAPEVFGLRTPDQAEATLRLLRDAGDLVLAPSEAEGRFSTPVTFPDSGRTRWIVIRNCSERLKAEFIGRARRYDERESQRRPVL